MTNSSADNDITPPVPNFAAGVPWPAADSNLLPAIAQDVETDAVLMMAWMDASAYQQTRQTGRATYFSRSRSKPWVKGESSGHVQHVESIHIDCDADTILLRVRQTGAACHEGYPTCFFRQLGTDGRLRITQRRYGESFSP